VTPSFPAKIPQTFSQAVLQQSNMFASSLTPGKLPILLKNESLIKLSRTQAPIISVGVGVQNGTSKDQAV
jgi:hypothetical protein